MTAKERLEIIGELEVKTGYPYEFLKKQTDEWLLREREVREGK
jgi:hypothetical protein